MTDTLARPGATVAARADADPAGSHTAALLAKGPGKCAEKFGEEAVEAIVAAAAGDRDGLVHEAADVLYHLQVMLRPRGSPGARCWRSSSVAKAGPDWTRKPPDSLDFSRRGLTSTRGALVIGGVSAARSRSGPRGEGNPVEPDTFEIRLEALSRLEDVWEAMVAFAGDCGVSRLGYHHLPPPGAPDAGLLRIENDGFGGELLAQYLAARTSGIAVLANIIQNSVRPVYLDELASLVDLTPAERAHLATYRAAGVRNGLGLQVFGPNGRNGIFAIDLGDGPRLAPEVMARLRWAGQAMHLRYCALLQPQLGTLPRAFVARGRGADLGGAGQDPTPRSPTSSGFRRTRSMRTSGGSSSSSGSSTGCRRRCAGSASG